MGATMTDRVLAELMGWVLVPWRGGSDPNSGYWADEHGAKVIETHHWNPSSDENQLAQCFEKAGLDIGVQAVGVWLEANHKGTSMLSTCALVYSWQTAPTKERADALAEVVGGGE